MRILVSFSLIAIASTTSRADTSDAKRELATFDRECDAGSARACDQLADRLDAGAAGRPSTYRHRIVALHRKACDGDDRHACAHSGRQRLADGDRVGAFIDLGKACELGDETSCDPAGLIAPKPQRARVLFLRACDARIASGCKHLADMFATGRGGERNWPRAIRYAEKACSLDGVSPCAHALELERDVPDGRCASEPTCQRLCDEGIGLSCRRLGELRDNDPDAFERGCEAGDGASCTLRGHAAETFEAGAKWYRRGCRAGDRTACTYTDYARARDGVEEAQSVLRARCTGDRDACVLLGLAIVDRQPAEAERHWQSACKRDQAVACRFVAQRLATGARSDRLMNRACTAGDGVACDALSLLVPPRRANVPAWQ